MFKSSVEGDSGSPSASSPAGGVSGVARPASTYGGRGDVENLVSVPSEGGQREEGVGDETKTSRESATLIGLWLNGC